MKAILKFNLDDPEDAEQFHICNKAFQYHSCLNDILDKLREIDKYSCKTIEENYNDLEKFIHEIINVYNLPINL